MYFAIRNKKTKKYIAGTDYRYNPPHQITATEIRPPKLFTFLDIQTEIRCRKINLKRYELVEVIVMEKSI